jgi:hypothetical protein
VSSTPESRATLSSKFGATVFGATVFGVTVAEGRISNLLGCRWQRMNPGAGFAGNPIESIEEGIHHRGTEAPRRGRSGSERIRIWFVKPFILLAAQNHVFIESPFPRLTLEQRQNQHFLSEHCFVKGINSDRARFEFSFGRCSFPQFFSVPL